MLSKHCDRDRDGTVPKERHKRALSICKSKSLKLKCEVSFQEEKQVLKIKHPFYLWSYFALNKSRS